MRLLSCLAIVSLAVGTLTANPHAQAVESSNPQETISATERLETARLWVADSDTKQKLLAALSGPDQAIQLAVAQALLESPESLAHDLRLGLSGLLSSQQSEIRSMAARALLADPNPAGFQPLREFVTDPNESAEFRHQIILLFRESVQRVVIGTLVDLARSSDVPAIRASAFEMLSEIAELDFEQQIDRLQNWWADARKLSEVDWLNLQMRRLAKKNNDIIRRAASLEYRLAQTLKHTYRTAQETERSGLLGIFLLDNLPAVQNMGLRLVQTELHDGQELPQDVREAVRSLVNSPQHQTRKLAIQTIAGIRDEADAPRFLEMLSSEQDLELRIVLVNALGYLGNGDSAEQLTLLLADSPQRLLLESLTALGRLSERGKISKDQREVLAASLVRLFQYSQDPDHPKLRERTLWAMSRVAPKNFKAEFTDALASSQPLEVREAALHGIRSISEPGMAAILANYAAEPDTPLRRQITDLLSQWVGIDQADLLFKLLNPKFESEQAIRESAWAGIVRLSADCEPTILSQWLTKLDVADAETPNRRQVLLLARFNRLRQDESPLEEQGSALRALADAEVQIGDRSAALSSLIERFRCCVPVEASDRGGEFVSLVVFALDSELYNEKFANELRSFATPPVDVVWMSLQVELNERINAEQSEAARIWLEQLSTHPPMDWTEKELSEMASMAQVIEQRLLSNKVEAALLTLQNNSEDEAAREVLKNTGKAALPLVRQQLAQTLAADPIKPDWERTLTELLGELDPEWPGFASDMPREERSRLLNELAQ